MMASSVAPVLEWIFFIYFACLQIGYFALAVSSFLKIHQHGRETRARIHSPVYRGYEPGVTVVVPTYNMATTIRATVKALIEQRYNCLQILIVNDGSTDDTASIVRQEYGMIPTTLPPRSGLASEEILGIYRSTGHDDIILIDKRNGRKSDAINAGLNYARYDLVCLLDADTVLEPDALIKASRIFIDREETVAASGAVRVLNGSHIGRIGFVDRVRLASTYFPLVQTVEYIRAFLFGRLGWASLNAVPILSGAFGLFDREILVRAGGFRLDTIGEDMEVTLRLHRYAHEHLKRYHIGFLPDPVCWTEVPETWTGMQQQRIRWHQGLSESIWMNRSIVFRCGAIGWVTVPFIIVFEWISPFVEVTGYVFAVTAYATGNLSEPALYSFMFLTMGMGILLSVSSIAMEEIALQLYPRYIQIFVLCIYAVLENVGYRQMHAAWRMIGFLRWLMRRQQIW